MDGIILIDKPKGKTSRDIVNEVSKIIGTKKIGHTGTLDPNATGLLVLCVNEGLKLVELLTGHDKDYIAKVKLGIRTDTYDITGKIIEENYNYELNESILKNILNSFHGEYLQEVPIYSAVKVHGKKLYEYARGNEKVSLPKHKVNIKKINLISFDEDSFTFFVSVSSGTYIRSLVNDISKKLGICMALEELRREKVGNFSVKEASCLLDIKIIPIIDSLNIKKVYIDDDLYKKVSNGVKIKNIYNENMVLFIKDNIPVSIYQSSDQSMMKLYRKFNM